MKVLFETYSTAFQNTAGGVHNRIEMTAAALRNLGVEVDFFDKFTTDLKDFDILHIFKLDSASKQLVDYAKSIGIKVVVSSIMSINKGWLVNCYQMLKHLPIATTYKQVFSVCSKLDWLIVETPKEATFMKKHYRINEEKISIVPNGSNVILNFDNSIYSFLGRKVNFALLLSRFDKNKNQLNVIKALKNTDIEIVFIGGADTSDPDYYDICLKEANGCDNIHFLGWLKSGNNLLQSAIGHASAIICSSYQETFGLSIAEGIMSGATPVISNTLPILNFKTFENCLTFRPNDIEDIRKKITEAVHTPKDFKLIEKAKKEFSWESVANKHLDIYRKLLNQR